MVRYIKLALLTAGVFGFCQMASAADAKIGFVDTQKALQQTKLGAKIQKDFESEVKGLQSSFEDKKEEYEKALESYNKQKESLSGKAKQEKEDELIKLDKEVKRLKADAEEQAGRKKNQLLGDFAQKLRTVIVGIGKDEGYTAIFERPVAVYAADGVDITDKVVKKFDETNK